MWNHVAIDKSVRRLLLVAAGLAGIWGSQACADTPPSPRADVARFFEAVRLAPVNRLAFPDAIAIVVGSRVTGVITPVEPLARGYGVAVPATVAPKAGPPVASVITPVELLARAWTPGTSVVSGTAGKSVGVALTPPTVATAQLPSPAYPAVPAAVGTLPLTGTVDLVARPPLRERLAQAQFPTEPVRGVSGDPVMLVSAFPLVSPGLPPAFSIVSLAIPQLPSTSPSACGLAVPIRLDQAQALGPVEVRVTARPPPMSSPVALTRPSRSLSLAVPVLKPPGQGDQWPKSGPLFNTVVVALSRCRCDPDKLDELLVANYRVEMQALAIPGKREALIAKALRLLNVVSSTDARRYAFETIMGASGLKRSKPQNAVAVFLTRFAAQSPDLQRRALLFAASWCYEQEAYSLALAKVADLKALPDNGIDIVAGALMTDGLCRVRLNQPREALAAFGAVVKDFGGTELAPKAQFLIGWLYLSNQENKKARTALQQVVKNYPKTEYATRAQRLLNTL